MAMLCTAAGNKLLFSNENKPVKSWWPANVKKMFPNTNEANFSKETIRLRKVMSTFLKPDSIRKHIGVMDQVTKHHFDKHWSSLDQKQVIMFQSLAKKYTSALSCRLFLNIEDPQVIAKLEKPIRHINVGLVSLPLDLPGTNFNRAIRASKKMREEIESMVVKRKIDLMNLNLIDREQLANAPQDLMSSLIRKNESRANGDCKIKR
ncbi:beta-amyrin 28-monooxygenase-like [Rosa rugosa]|uniref:beta-amyrin 28-monooxygenase-like n=1 Tax=Rosa rugosa TaxID=74645 RepID=UPI002B402ADE|nr:beta-amyrin 28-monooxygenase-like [Rosa rugosa]